MDLLITLIGNAVVDPAFRARFLADPLGIADAYGFRMTKAEVDLMLAVFTQEPDTITSFETSFHQLQETLYARQQCPTPPCGWSLYPPPQFRDDYQSQSQRKPTKK